MSPRKKILKNLDQIHKGEGAGHYTRPSTLPGYSSEVSKYQEAVNALLKDRLIDGKKDEGGHMAIALNPHRLMDVRRELRPWFLRPATLVAVIATVGLLAPFLI